MATTLTDRLSRLVKTMRGQARITEANVQDMLREVRMALLEAVGEVGGHGIGLPERAGQRGVGWGGGNLVQAQCQSDTDRTLY